MLYLGFDFNLQEVFELKAMLHDLEEQLDNSQLGKDNTLTKPGK